MAECPIDLDSLLEKHSSSLLTNWEEAMEFMVGILGRYLVGLYCGEMILMVWRLKDSYEGRVLLYRLWFLCGCRGGV